MEFGKKTRFVFLKLHYCPARALSLGRGDSRLTATVGTLVKVCNRTGKARVFSTVITELHKHIRPFP